MSAPLLHITYYLDLMSSWCTYVEPVWDELQERYEGRVDFEWKIALMNRGDFPVSNQQCAWFYQRSGTMQPQAPRLTPDWFEAERQGNYEAPQRVAEAGRDFGCTDDSLRRALARAGLQEGQKIGDLETSLAIASREFSLDADQLRATATSEAVRERLAASTAEFHSHQLSQRPAFIITSSIGDKAVFSGLINRDTLVNTLDTMLAEAQGYYAFNDQFGPMPTD